MGIRNLTYDFMKQPASNPQGVLPNNLNTFGPTQTVSTGSQQGQNNRPPQQPHDTRAPVPTPVIQSNEYVLPQNSGVSGSLSFGAPNVSASSLSEFVFPRPQNIPVQSLGAPSTPAAPQQGQKNWQQQPHETRTSLGSGAPVIQANGTGMTESAFPRPSNVSRSSWFGALAAPRWGARIGPAPAPKPGSAAPETAFTFSNSPPVVTSTAPQLRGFIQQMAETKPMSTFHVPVPTHSGTSPLSDTKSTSAPVFGSSSTDFGCSNSLLTNLTTDQIWENYAFGGVATDEVMSMIVVEEPDPPQSQSQYQRSTSSSHSGFISVDSHGVLEHRSSDSLGLMNSSGFISI